MHTQTARRTAMRRFSSVVLLAAAIIATVAYTTPPARPAGVQVGGGGVVTAAIRADEKHYPGLRGRSGNFKPVKVARDQSNDPRTDRLARVGFHPEVDGELIGRIEAGRLGNLHVVIDPVETEGLAHAACGKSGSILERAVIGPDRVQTVPFPTPPTDQTRRRRQARRNGSDCQNRVAAGNCPKGVTDYQRITP